MDVYTIVISLFFAFLTFGLTGFGSGLIGMALLTPALGLGVAAPMFSLLAMVAEILMFYRYRQHIQLQAVWRLTLGSIIAIPIGILILPTLNGHFTLVILGIIVAGYACYSLFTPHLPQLVNHTWGFLFGFVSGLLTGGYNSGGPPLVIYGNLAKWQPQEYKSNLPGMFIVSSVVVIASHFLAGHYTATVLQDTAIGVPSMLIGLLVGWGLDKRINPQMFRKMVLFLLVVIGVQLIVGNL